METVLISNKFSLKHVPSRLIDNESAFVQVMAWLITCDKPLSEPILTKLPDYIWWLHHNELNIVKKITYAKQVGKSK